MVSFKLVQLALVALTVAVQGLPTAVNGDGELVKMSAEEGSAAELDARQGPCPPCGLVSSVSTCPPCARSLSSCQT